MITGTVIGLFLSVIVGIQSLDMVPAIIPRQAIAQTPATTVTTLSMLVGEAAEACATERTMPGAMLLSSTDPWQTFLTDGAHPGREFLLRGGLYQATDKLWLKAGTPDRPLVIKPYGCEAVTIQGSIRPQSHTIIAGIRIEAIGIEDTKWAIRFDGKNEAAITNVILRNNTILGGTIDAIRLSDAVDHVWIQGNHIDGGESGHDIFVTAELVDILPDAITISQNRLTKAYFEQPSEDMIQVRDVGAITITANLCTDGLDMEQCIDIKNSAAPLLIAYNLFDGDNLHLLGEGEDGSGGCMVIHENDGHPEQHIIEYNYFRYCKGSAIRFATGKADEASSALARYNLFLQSTIDDGHILVEKATDLHFVNNSVIMGKLKLGNSSQTRLPDKTLIQQNIFYQSAIEDNLPPASAAYHCLYNLLYNIAGDGFLATPCRHTIAADPLFFDRAQLDFHLQPGSPAVGRGEQGGDIGAFPMKFPPDALLYPFYLPLILQ